MFEVTTSTLHLIMMKKFVYSCHICHSWCTLSFIVLFSGTNEVHHSLIRDLCNWKRLYRNWFVRYSKRDFFKILLRALSEVKILIHSSLMSSANLSLFCIDWLTNDMAEEWTSDDFLKLRVWPNMSPMLAYHVVFAFSDIWGKHRFV